MADVASVGKTSVTDSREGSYVDWPCALAGAVTAAATSSVLLTFGSGIGLSLLSPWPAENVSMLTFALITAVWAVFVQLISFGAGGYLAGRMRRRWKDASADEVRFRDGVHGALVWATAVVIGALLLAMTAAGAVRTSADLAGNALSGASSNMVAGTDTSLSALFRTNQAVDATNRNAARDEARGLLATGLASGSINDEDRSYLAQLVSRGTGLAQPEAEQRVAQVVNEARDAADRARKTGIVAAFLVAASLLAGGAFSWYVAQVGGQHRDQGVFWRGFRQSRVPTGTTNSTTPSNTMPRR